MTGFHPPHGPTRSICMLAFVVLCTGALTAQQPAFRLGINLVSLNVTATDGSSRYVTDLGQQDFLVFEDNVPQDVSFFSKSQVPIALALLIDTSASMEGKLSTAQEAAVGFAHRLQKDDVAEVIDFDSAVTVAQPFTANVGDLERAIRGIAAGGSTSLFNAIYIALKELRKAKTARNPDEVRRQAIVILSDGEDTSSLLPFEEVLDEAKRSGTIIYTIGLRSLNEVTRRKEFKDAKFVLRQFAQQTGGRPFFVDKVADLSGVYLDIAQELSSQYTLAYTPKTPHGDGGWRRVAVRVSRPNVIARTKQGYYAPVFR